MERVFNVRNLSNKSVVRFTTEDRSIDFLNASIVVRVFNGLNNEFMYDFNVEIKVAEDNQAVTSMFDVRVPKNVESLKFEFKSDTIPLDIITCLAL